MYQNDAEQLHMTLQQIIVDHMEQNDIFFDPYVEHEDIFDITPAEYYQHMRQSKTYGSHQEIYAFQRLFHISVQVLDRRGINYNSLIPNDIPIVNAKLVAVVVYDFYHKHYDTARPPNDDDNDDNANDKNNEEDRTTEMKTFKSMATMPILQEKASEESSSVDNTVKSGVIELKWGVRSDESTKTFATVVQENTASVSNPSNNDKIIAINQYDHLKEDSDSETVAVIDDPSNNPDTLDSNPESDTPGVLLYVVGGV